MFPSIRIVWWMGETLGVDDKETLMDLAVGGYLAYLFLRLQDDVMDGHAYDSGGLLVGNACLGEFYDTYRAHFASEHRFWSLRKEIYETFSSTTLWELRRHREKRTPFTTPDIYRLGDKFIPAAVPPMAVALLKEKDAQAHQIRELVSLMGCGLQMVNDHKGIQHDFATENYTAVINDILLGVPSIRELEVLAFPQRALTSSAMLKNLQRGTMFFEQALAVAQELRCQGAIDYCRRHLRALQRELFRVEEMCEGARILASRDPRINENGMGYPKNLSGGRNKKVS